MDEKRCEVEFLPHKKFGWVIKPGDGCEAVFKEVADYQGPYARKYLDARKVDRIPENTDEQPPKSPE